MLQWMGGSRRKVTASRKSMQKRQKQYFEQKKRQQQTTGLENYADGINTCGQHHENPRSLDILSLLNLATLAQECNSVHTNARENPGLNASPQNYYVSKSQPTRFINKVTPRDSTDLEEAGTVPSVYRVETVSPNKGFSTCHDDTRASVRNYPLNRNGDKLDHWETDTEQQLSVVDLLGDDGPNGSSEGCPVHENHVAFSVEGLGEVGKETPVHSPRQPNRFFSEGCSSPPNGLSRVHSSKDLKYILDNLELEMNAMIHDINMPLGGGSMELPFKSRGIADCSGNSKSTKFSVKGCMPIDARGSQIDNFLCEEEYFCNNMEEKNEKTWNARSGFLDNNFLDEREYGTAWRNLPYQIDGDSAGFLGAKNHKMPDFSFEGTNSIKKRAADKAADRSSILESPSPYFNHPALEKDYDFMSLDGARFPTVDGRSDFKGVANEPAWSYFPTEDARDSMSLLSEESCSSSAVRGDKADNSASNSTMPTQGMRRHGSEIRRSPETNYGMKNLYADETRYNWDETHQGKHLNASGKYNTRVPCLLRSKPVHFSNSTVQKSLEPQNIWLFEERRTSIDMDSGLSSFCRTSEETEPATLGRKLWSEDPFVAFPVPKLHHNTNLSIKRSKPHVPVECAPSGSFFSEKDIFQQPFRPVHSYDSPIFSNIRSRSRNPDIFPVFEMEGVHPYSSHVAGSQGDLSGQESDSKDGEDKSKFQPTDCRKFHKEPQKEFSIGNNDLSSENEKSVDALDSKVNYSEYNPELIERPNTQDSPEKSEETSSSAIKQIPDKLESCINEKKYQVDAHNPLPSQNGSKGKEESGAERRKIGSKGQSSCSDPPYQAMLESYVLQLVCVHKVLKEASEQDSTVEKRLRKSKLNSNSDRSPLLFVSRAWAEVFRLDWVELG